jgi:hypothetical protein
MVIKRFMSKAEAEKLIACDNPCDTMLNEIVKGLQTDSSQYVEIDIQDVDTLSARLRYLKRTNNISYDYKHLKIFKTKTKDGQIIGFARWTEQVDEPKVHRKVTKKEKNVKPNGTKTEANIEQKQNPEQQPEHKPEQTEQKPEQQVEQK